MNWIFFDKNKALVEAWQSVGLGARVATLDRIVNEVNWRFLLTPGNSFGIMDGGFDQVVCQQFGSDVEKKVRAAIARWHGGLCPVGSCVSVPLDNSGRHLIYAPTMEMPQQVRYTLNVFWAMRSAAMRVKLNWTADMSDQFAISPGFGSLTGKLPPVAAAAQMAAALDVNEIKVRNWAEVKRVLAKIDRLRSL